MTADAYTCNYRILRKQSRCLAEKNIDPGSAVTLSLLRNAGRYLDNLFHLMLAA